MKKVSWWRTSFIWLFIPAIFYLCAFLLFPAFNIIDDGASLLVAENLKNHFSISEWSKVLIETQVGRFRPFYHLSLSVIYFMFGFQPFFFWFAQVIVLGLTLIGMAIFLYKVTKQYWLAGIVPLLLLLLSPVAQNFYRLGTAEPKQMLVWTWLLVLMVTVKEKGWSWLKLVLSVILFVTALLLKEISFIFAGMIGFLAVWPLIFERGKVNLKKTWPTWAILVILAILTGGFLMILPRSGSYSSSFQLNLPVMLGRLMAARLEYAAVLFPVTLATLAMGLRVASEFALLKKIRWENFFWPGLLLSQLILMVAIGILPWQFQLPRYYYPVYLIGLLFVTVEVVQWRTVWLQLAKLPTGLKLQLTTLAVGVAAFLQLIIFQSGQDLSLRLEFVLLRLEAFLLETAPITFLLLIGVGLTVVRLVALSLSQAKKLKLSLKNYQWQLWTIIMFTGMLIISGGFWVNHWPRAYLLMNILVAVYYFTEWWSWQTVLTASWWKKLKLGTWLSLSTAMLLALLMINQTLLQGKGTDLSRFFGVTITHLQTDFDTHQISYALIEKLFKETPEGTRVFVSSDDYEIVFEIGLYASRLKQRQVTIYTNNQQLITDVGKDFPYLQFVADPVAAFVEADQPKLLLVRRQTWDAFTGRSLGEKLTPTLQQDMTLTDWSKYSATELTPKVTFYTIPPLGYWVMVK